ncbi:U-box domain-containing protein 51 (Plant U-box protein 51) [Includes: E3 ubiquitin ligase (RING-type E3 ubiquitin transferase) [Durusdinium trenchii]|uniref:U-box domain-containing protein 51 (Plant U-box protein 51) n=1 Tax=Durusdinium trenchii TaxID=1381693 RepID=A0ABP0KEK3_9DINO
MEEGLVDPMPDRPAKMRRVEEPSEPSAPSTEKGISRVDSEKILRMSQKGMSVDAIADVWNVEAVEIVKTLELMRSGKDSQSDAQAGSEHGWTSLVKRLMEDPPDLCCPISQELMEDPVVAADGITYERRCIAEWFYFNSGSPTTREPLLTRVLNPSQHMKSAVIAYKERTVQEILSVAAELQGAEALKLLSRGEQFVRSSLPDVSAKKKLSSLLLLRGKRMKPGSRSKVNQELVPMLLEVGDTPQLQELLADMNEQEVIWLLHQVDGDVLESLSVPGPHKILVCKELARRITDSPVAEAQAERLSLLWDFLSQEQENQDDQDWAQAASLMLAAFHGRLTAKLERLDTKLLHHALTFLHNKERATAFARDFFTCDFGISTLEKWPPSKSASIFVELASRMDDDKDDEKLDLLVKAHGINDADAHVCRALSKQICRRMLCQRTTSDSKHLEGLLLKVQLEQVEDIPAEVVSKLCLEQESLKSLHGSQLMLLAKMLEKANRRADGARVALAAAEFFLPKRWRMNLMTPSCMHSLWTIPTQMRRLCCASFYGASEASAKNSAVNAESLRRLNRPSNLPCGT